MSIDKSWIYSKNRYSDEYWHGIYEFITLCSGHAIPNEENYIRCPCNKCLNQSWGTLITVAADIIDHGFDPNYTIWIYHGEKEVYANDPILDEMGNELANLAITKTVPNPEPAGSSNLAPLALPPANVLIRSDLIADAIAIVLKMQHDCANCFESLRRVFPDFVLDSEPSQAREPLVLPVPGVESPPELFHDQIAAMNAIMEKIYQDFTHLFMYLRRVYPHVFHEHDLNFEQLSPSIFGPAQPLLPPSQPLSSSNDDDDDDDDYDYYEDDYDFDIDDDEVHDNDNDDDDDDDDEAKTDSAE